jgi:hypothetical protein
MTVKPSIYRITGAVPGSAAVVSTISLGASDTNTSLALHPVKRGSGTARSYLAVLALGFASDPGTISSLYLWAVLSGGSLDAYVTVKVATTLATTYVRATGTEDDTGNSILSVYGLATEDLLAYTSGSPKKISGTDLIKTTGTGIFTKYLPIQIEFGAAAALGAHPNDPVELKLFCAAMES